MRHAKLSRSVARRSPGEQQLSVARKLVNSRVAVTVGDIQSAVGRDRQIRRKAERPGGLANVAIVDGRGAGVRRAAARAERQQQFALRRELANRVVQVIAAIDRIVGTDVDAVRAREDPLAPRLQESPVRRKDHHRPLGAVEDIHPVLRVGGHRGYFAAGRQLAPIGVSRVSKVPCTDGDGRRRIAGRRRVIREAENA